MPGVKTFYKTPNPADVGGLGVSPGQAGAIRVVKSPEDLDEEALVKFFQEALLIADNIKAPREPIWDDCWDLYNGVYDWSTKAWWQSRANIPKVRASVDRAVGIFRKSLLRLRRFYQIQSDSKQGKQKGLFTGELMDFWFTQVGAVEALAMAMKVGLITSTITAKVWWERVREDKPRVVQREKPIYNYGVETGMEVVTELDFVDSYRGRLGVQALDPYDVWVVPYTNGTSIIERFEIGLPEIQRGVDDGIYLKDALEKVKTTTSPTKDKHWKRARRANEYPVTGNQHFRRLEGFHYWGDIYNLDGEIVMPSASFSVINDDILLRPARPNPFYHKRPPYIIGTPYTVPFSTYNRGMVEDVMEIAKSITELTNLIIDGAMYDALKAFAIDADSLDDPAEARDGIHPGKAFVKRSSQAPSPDSKAIETIDVGNVPKEAMNALGLLHSAFQEGTYMNEWVGSGSRGGSAETLGEVNIKTQTALEGLDEAARNVELTVLEPFLDLSAKTIYQFHEDYSIPRLVEQFPGAAAMLQQFSPPERYALMVGGYEFKAHGLSVTVDQMQRLGEIGNFLTMISHIPGLMQEIDPTELLEALMLPLNWNVEKLLLKLKGQPLNPNPMVPAEAGNLSPAQAQNAQSGRMMGGAANNPMAAQSGQGGGPQMQQLLQLIQGGRR